LLEIPPDPFISLLFFLFNPTLIGGRKIQKEKKRRGYATQKRVFECVYD
jgi:hypothetical protein